jgi:membrane protease YdiL (CAAX protease family)
VAAVLASRVVGGPLLTAAAPRLTGRPARSLAEVAVLVAVCVPAAAALANHSLGDERPVLPLGRPPVLAVAAVVILAAVLNAAAEELFWRGAAMRLLADSGHRTPTTIGLQAVSFGAAHAAGLPGGVPGAVGALGLGLLLGVLRLRPSGVRGCVVVHTAVDVALFGVLAARIVWVG